jgi:hypothetical protein
MEPFTQMATTRQQVLLETLAARQRAAELLKTLEQARCECEQQLRTEQRQDAMKTVTGKSSIESAIAQTKRMVELLDRAMEEARGAGYEGGGGADVEVVARIGGASGRVGSVGA